MSLDAETSRLTKFGRVTYDAGIGITVEGFEGENCTCRDVVALALAHAIRDLSEELRLTIEAPGQGIAVVE
jgi:hypothetical protein